MFLKCFRCGRKREKQVHQVNVNQVSSNEPIYGETDRYLPTYQVITPLRTEINGAAINAIQPQTTDLDEPEPNYDLGEPEPVYDYIKIEETIKKEYNTLKHESDGGNKIIRRSYLTPTGVSPEYNADFIVGSSGYDSPREITISDIEEDIYGSSKTTTDKGNIYQDINDHAEKIPIQNGTKNNVYNIIEEDIYANAKINRKSCVIVEENSPYENIDFSKKRIPLYHSNSIEHTAIKKPPIPLKRSKTLTQVNQTIEVKTLQDSDSDIYNSIKEIKNLEEPVEELYVQTSRQEILVKQIEIEESVKTIEMLNRQRNLIRLKKTGVKNLINNFEMQEEDIIIKKINVEDNKLKKLRAECVKIIASIDEIEAKK